MALIVHKYGGTSMGSVERIQNVARRVAKWHAAGHQMVVVPSAMSGETNRLIALANEIQPQPDPRELDMIASTGEQVSVGLLAMALKSIGVDAVSYAGWQVPIRTDGAYTKARILSIDDTRVRADLAGGRVVIITGFQGVDANGNITTLGRGGSDTSAVAIAAALKADECLIYTDVDGVYTTDPRIVPEARRLEKITFEEMLEMASLGVEGAADPLGRVRRQVQGQDAGAVEPHAARHSAGRRGRLRHPDHVRGRRNHGTGGHLRDRVQPRRSQDHRDQRARQARHRVPDPRAGRRGEHRRRHDHPERERRGA